VKPRDTETRRQQAIRQRRKDFMVITLFACLLNGQSFERFKGVFHVDDALVERRRVSQCVDRLPTRRECSAFDLEGLLHVSCCHAASRLVIDALQRSATHGEWRRETGGSWETLKFQCTSISEAGCHSLCPCRPRHRF